MWKVEVMSIFKLLYVTEYNVLFFHLYYRVLTIIHTFPSSLQPSETSAQVCPMGDVPSPSIFKQTRIIIYYNKIVLYILQAAYPYCY